MSLLAGFDFVIEVSRAKVLELIQSTVTLGGARLVAPFELLVPVQSAGVTGSAHIIVTSLGLDLQGDHDVKLTMVFGNGSVLVESPFTRIVSLLDGTVTVVAPLTLAPSGVPGRLALGAELGAATCSVAFSPAAEARIAAGMAGTPVTVAAAGAAATDAVTAFLHAEGRRVLPTTFLVKPGQVGSISRGQFDRLEVHNIGTGGIGLFAMLLPDAPLGAHGGKTLAIPAGRDIAVHISARAFHRLIFCPNFAERQGVGVGQLPPSCGGAGGLERDGMTLTSFSDSFAPGHIDLNGAFEKSGFCYEATGTFHGVVTMTIVGGQLVSTVAMDEPSVDVDMPWYCWLAGIVLGPIGWVLLGAAHADMDAAEDKLNEAVKGMTGKGGPQFGVEGFQGTTFDAVALGPEGISLSGRMPVALWRPDVPRAALDGAVVTVQDTVIGSGVYHFPPGGCMKGDYAYRELARAQKGTFVIVPVLLGRPLSVEWRLQYWQGIWSYGSSPTLVSEVILTGAGGTATLSGVECRFAVPLPAGATVTKSVQVGYSIGTNTARVTNLPSDGSYAVTLAARVVDPVGQAVTASTGVMMEGSRVEFGPDYYARLARCQALLRARIRKIRKKPKRPKRLKPPKGPKKTKRTRRTTGVARPSAAQRLAAAFRELLEAPGRQDQEILAQTSRASIHASLAAIVEGGSPPIRPETPPRTPSR